MNLGKVSGTVVCTRKLKNLEGFKFLIVEIMNPKGQLTGNFVVSVDTIGCGQGETVLLCSGSSARQCPETTGRTIDNAIVAKVDEIDLFQS